MDDLELVKVQPDCFSERLGFVVFDTKLRTGVPNDGSDPQVVRLIEALLVKERVVQTLMIVINFP